jgi:hypothetical protein
MRAALDMEETNTNSHRNYLATEEARRSQATTIRRAYVKGPRIRWISRAERMKPHHFYSGQYSGSWNNTGYGLYNPYQFYGQHPPGTPGLPLHSSPANRSPGWYHPASGKETTFSISSSQRAKDLLLNLPQQFQGPQAATTSRETYTIESYKHNPSPFSTVQAPQCLYFSFLFTRSSSMRLATKTSPALFPYPGYYFPTTATQSGPQSQKSWRHTMNYVLHQTTEPDDELSDRDHVSQSRSRSRRSVRGLKTKRKTVIPWEQHMSALFGDHVDWCSMRVITRHRPPGEIRRFVVNLGMTLI